MQRFCDPDVWNADEAAVRAVRDFVVGTVPHRVCWSVCCGPNGKLNANAVSHSDFGHTIMCGSAHNTTIDAIRLILKDGTFC
jgi:hypothetical protein